MANGKIDKALQQLLAMAGEKTEIELLWQNASPGSTFADQTISLDLSTYGAVMVIFRVSNSFEYTFAEFCLVGNKGMASSIQNTNANNMLLGDIGAQIRNYEPSISGVHFSGSVYSHSNGYKGTDGGCVPVNICGVKI